MSRFNYFPISFKKILKIPRYFIYKFLKKYCIIKNENKERSRGLKISNE